MANSLRKLRELGRAIPYIKTMGKGFYTKETII